LTIPQKREIFLKLLPDYESGKISARELNQKSGLSTGLTLISLRNGKVREGAEILRGATSDQMEIVKGVARRVHEDYKNSGMSEKEWSATRRANASKQRRSEEATNPNEPLSTQTPGLNVEGLYGQGIESQERAPSIAANPQSQEIPAPGFFKGVSGPASQGDAGIESAADQFRTNILPELHAGTMSLQKGSLALRKNHGYLSSLISIEEGTFKEDHFLFSKLGDEGKRMLRQYMESARERAHDAGYKTYGAYAKAERNSELAREARSGQIELNLQKRQKLIELLPNYESGKLSGNDVEAEIGLMRGDLSKVFSVEKGTLNRKSAILDGASASEISLLKEAVDRMHGSYVDSKTTLRKWAWNRLQDAGQQSERSSNPNQPLIIDTPGLSFDHVYNQVESQAGGSSTPGSQQPQGMPTDRPSPGLLDARASTGGMSVTPSHQTAPPAPVPLSDYEIRTLHKGLSDPVRPLQSVSDVAIWLNIENDVSRVTPYAFDVENEGQVQLQLTDLGKAVLEERGLDLNFDNPSKSTRHGLLKKQPAPAQVRRMEMKMGQLRIVERQDGWGAS
jgi:hypothetical protein